MAAMGITSLFSKKTRVIIDTNFLLLPGSQGIDIFTEVQQLIDGSLELCIVESTNWELQNIIDGLAKGKTKGSDKFNAKLGLILAKQKGLKVLKSSQITNFADQAILELSKEGMYVATLDKELQGLVKKKGGKVITVRQKKHLVVQG